ncbi:MAG: hypothetical protein ABI321_21345 [Polyangia bacterium]
MKPRSPVLGYNHNLRYAARVWHVQTEDSGVQNPHIFTHLFSEGTIIASKKTDYDAASDVPVVQKLMQTQHKTMMRDLKAGVFDEKIEKYYGPIVRDVDTDPAIPAQPAPAVAAPPPRERSETIPQLQHVAPPPAPSPPPVVRSVPGVLPARSRQASLTPARPSVSVHARSNPASPPPTIGSRAQQRTAPPTIGSSRSGVMPAMRPVAHGGVVSRPSVIVGGGGNKEPSKKKGESVEFWKSNERRDPATFGENLISERSLDEVILAYLSEDAPKK